ncbi:MAG TPA: chromosomal replication initiator protein DnaA [Candidatus Saccharimonadales bacterium]|nr:chromosomal replication initiator protein DnaA [Candidatus Saccharimonadales bacterium]
MPVDLHPLWADVVERLQSKTTAQTFHTWIEPLRPVAFSESALELEVPNAFFADWIDSHYLELIRQSAAEAAGRSMDVTLRVNPETPVPAPAPAPDEDDPRRYLDTESHLNRQFTLETFVVGSGNQLAAAAAHAVAERPGFRHNPLFIYGGVGLGKTHLLHAIGQVVKARKPDTKVLYVSSERFTNELISALQSGSMAEFKQRYRSLDLLLIDDIQFLAGKERTQEEFFHTFNSLHETFKQIVLSSDQPPRDIPALQERLVSRFNWGLVADIQPPDLETRVAILRNRADRERVNLPGEVALFVAHNVTSNIRELEGALTKVLAFSRLTNQPLTITLAEEVLRDVMRRSERRVGVPEILRETCSYFAVAEENVCGPRRNAEYTRPRQVCMFLSRELTRHSLGEIGSHFGDRDHTTVMHAIDKISGLLERDPGIQEAVTKIRERLAQRR